MMIRSSRYGQSRRAGISLIEVMFSMAVGFMGLLGVAALIPLTANQLGRATRADRAAAFGISAIEDLQARGYTRPTAWAIWNVNTSQYEFLVAFNTAGAPNGYQTNTGPGWMPGDSFCLDPNMLSRYSGAQSAQHRFFPTLMGGTPGPGEPVMWRLTLLDVPNLNTAATNISRAHVEETFVSRDDLLFSRPVDATLPPLQEFSMNPVPGPDKRQFEARLSYMATFSPFIDLADTHRPNGFPHRGAYGQQNSYTMSVVVYDRRSLDPTSEGDRTAVAFAFPGMGLGGGDVILQAGTEEQIAARSGDWIMLGTQLPAGTRPSIFRWYRVLSADREAIFDSGAGVYRREVYLEGADWPFADTTAFTTYATIHSGIAAVFEKTVRLEGLSP